MPITLLKEVDLCKRLELSIYMHACGRGCNSGLCKRLELSKVKLPVHEAQMIPLWKRSTLSD